MTLVVRIMVKYTRVAGYGTGLEMEKWLAPGWFLSYTEENPNTSIKQHKYT